MQGLLAIPRMELYVGGAEKPSYDTLCTGSPKLDPDTRPKKGILVVAALCDGPRLVATAEDYLKPAKAVPNSHFYLKMQHRLIHAIDISVAQTPIQQYG